MNISSTTSISCHFTCFLKGTESNRTPFELQLFYYPLWVTSDPPELWIFYLNNLKGCSFFYSWTHWSTNALWGCATSCLYHGTEQIIQMAGTWRKIKIYKHYQDKNQQIVQKQWAHLVSELCRGKMRLPSSMGQEGRKGIKITGNRRARLGQLPDTDPVSKGTWARHNGEHTSGGNKGPPRKCKKRLKEATWHMGGE